MIAMAKPKMSAFIIDRSKIKEFISEQNKQDWDRIYKMAKIFERNQEIHKKAKKIRYN